MDHSKVYPVPTNFKSLCDQKQYRQMYEESIKNPDSFWGREAKRLKWIQPWTKVKETSFSGDVTIRWFAGGKLNVSENCIDRHLEKHAGEVAFIFEGDDPNEPNQSITYQALYEKVCQFANGLKKIGVKKGDRVTIYMPMILEGIYAMLACSRIGAVHSVVFGGFSPKSLADRIRDCESQFLITADEGLRGGKKVPLKKNADEALKECPDVKSVVVVRRTGGHVEWNGARDHWYHELCEPQPKSCPPEPMDSEDPLFILYTSGSTGKPKGVLHTTGGFLLYAAMTHEYIFDYHPGEIYWCTADIGWVTGHSYIVYGPLANRATTLIFEGIPTYPSYSRHWEIVDKHKVNIYYTAPTALRTLMREGESHLKSTHRESLRILGSVGEPINPEAWHWFYHEVGKERCPIVDTWWQTETGGILISPFPGATPLKPGSAASPFFGVVPSIVNEKGEELAGEAEGQLCINDSWPGQMRTVYKDHARFVKTYFSTFPNRFFTGDGCRRDKDGYYWITGRVDDVINVSGHRIGTAEVESALVAHPATSEAAVVGFPHEIKGQALYAYVTLKSSHPPSEALRKELIQWVRKELGPIATPDVIQWAPALPKTRSGKIMRRILRKIAAKEFHDLGDTTTLADPAVVVSLIENR